MAIEFNFTPELHLRDGRIIRHLEDAIDFASRVSKKCGPALISAMRSCMQWNRPRRRRKLTWPGTDSYDGWRS